MVYSLLECKQTPQFGWLAQRRHFMDLSNSNRLETFGSLCNKYEISQERVCFQQLQHSVNLMISDHGHQDHLEHAHHAASFRIHYSLPSSFLPSVRCLHRREGGGFLWKAQRLYGKMNCESLPPRLANNEQWLEFKKKSALCHSI